MSQVFASHGLAFATQGDQQSQLIQVWDFGRNEDRNRDRWPDVWKRRVGREHPKYLPVQIVARHADRQADADSARRLLARFWLAQKLGKAPWEVVPETVPVEIDQWLEKALLNPCLEMTLDGGAVDVQAPKFPVESSFSYAFEFEMETQSLTGFQARAELVLFDSKDRVVQVVPSPNLQGTTAWKEYRIGPIDIRDEDVTSGQIRIVVEPEAGGGLTGIVRVDRIRIWKMPQLMIRLNQPVAIYRSGEPVQLFCMASGLVSESPTISIEMENHLGETVAKTKLEIPTNAPSKLTSAKLEDPEAESTTQSSNASKSGGSKGSSKKKQAGENNASSAPIAKRNDWKGEATWEIPELQPGFYTIRCELARSNSYVFSREASFAVLSKNSSDVGDPRFGWALPNIENEIPISAIPSFLKMAAVRSVKIPVWINPEDEKRCNELAWLIERLKNMNVETVGVLDQPPLVQRRLFNSTNGEASIETILEQESIWQQLLEPVLTRMCMELKHFQAGWDRNNNFTGNDRLVKSLGVLRQQLRQYGSETLLTVPWDAMQETGPGLEQYIDRLQLYTTPPWTPDELRAFVKVVRNQNVPYWVGLGALDSQRYSPTDRVIHLMESMAAVAESNVEHAWIAQPFSVEQDFMRPNGQPGFLFLPFRQISSALAEKQYAGQLLLPNKSRNHVFMGQNEAVLLLWNPTPAIERFCFGDKLTAVDLFGREVAVDEVPGGFGREQLVPVGPWPVVLKGMDPNVIQWTLGLQFENPVVETTLSGRQTMDIKFENATSSPIRGTLTMKAPDVIQESSNRYNFQVGANSEKVFPVEIDLRQDATSQKKLVRLDIDASGQKEYQFSVYRELQVGSGDLELSIEQYVDDDDNLVVTIELTNNTGKVGNFECMISMQDRARERTQILNVMERATQVVRFPNASALKDKSIWFRCQEIGSGRIVNERILVVEP